MAQAVKLCTQPLRVSINLLYLSLALSLFRYVSNLLFVVQVPLNIGYNCYSMLLDDVSLVFSRTELVSIVKQNIQYLASIRKVLLIKKLTVDLILIG